MDRGGYAHLHPHKIENGVRVKCGKILTRYTFSNAVPREKTLCPRCEAASLSPQVHSLRYTDRKGFKLYTSQVEEMRRLHAQGYTQVYLASFFDVSQATVSQILNHVTWKE